MKIKINSRGKKWLFSSWNPIKYDKLFLRAILARRYSKSCFIYQHYRVRCWWRQTHRDFSFVRSITKEMWRLHIYRWLPEKQDTSLTLPLYFLNHTIISIYHTNFLYHTCGWFLSSFYLHVDFILFLFMADVEVSSLLFASYLGELNLTSPFKIIICLHYLLQVQIHINIGR